jgi:hypothetical protein
VSLLPTGAFEGSRAGPCCRGGTGCTVAAGNVIFTLHALPFLALPADAPGCVSPGFLFEKETGRAEIQFKPKSSFRVSTEGESGIFPKLSYIFPTKTSLKKISKQPP